MASVVSWCKAGLRLPALAGADALQCGIERAVCAMDRESLQEDVLDALIHAVGPAHISDQPRMTFFALMSP